jgi:ArsR family transcriptional regulator
MNVANEYYAQLFKALSDPNRLLIVEMLSRGELCACVILEKLRITQPTLSHHMKSLCDCELVHGRKVGKWTYYSLDEEAFQGMQAFWEDIAVSNKNRINQDMTSRKGCC